MRSNLISRNPELMKTSVSVSLRSSVERVFDFLCDLTSYSEIIPFVHEVVPSVASGDRVWDVELRAKVGPFARSKKLRMKRSICEPHERVVFVRDESDGRDHADWTLTIDTNGTQSNCNLEITLEYGGRLWTAGVMERILHENIEEGTRRLTEKFG